MVWPMVSRVSSSPRQGYSESDQQRPVQAGGGALDTIFSPSQAAFVYQRDAVGDLQHGGAPRHQLVIKEGVAPLVALLRRPRFHPVEHAPVVFDLRAQREERLALGCIERAAVGLQHLARIRFQCFQPGPLRRRAAGIGRKQKVAHIGAGKVDLRADLVQRAHPFQERFRDSRFLAADPVERQQRTGCRCQNP
jgi:hypothetical protein